MRTKSPSAVTVVRPLLRRNLLAFRTYRSPPKWQASYISRRHWLFRPHIQNQPNREQIQIPDGNSQFHTPQKEQRRGHFPLKLCPVQAGDRDRGAKWHHLPTDFYLTLDHTLSTSSFCSSVSSSVGLNPFHRALSQNHFIHTI